MGKKRGGSGEKLRKSDFCGWKKKNACGKNFIRHFGLTLLLVGVDDPESAGKAGQRQTDTVLVRVEVPRNVVIVLITVDRNFMSVNLCAVRCSSNEMQWLRRSFSCRPKTIGLHPVFSFCTTGGSQCEQELLVLAFSRRATAPAVARLNLRRQLAELPSPECAL